MTHSALTAEQRAAIKTRAQECRAKAGRLEQLEQDISALEGWRIKSLIPNGAVRQGIQVLRDDSVAYFTDGRACHAFKGPLLHRVITLGIDTLIAQLEQELADLDKPQGIERFPVVSRFEVPLPADCPICKAPCRGHNGEPVVTEVWGKAERIKAFDPDEQPMLVAAKVECIHLCRSHPDDDGNQQCFNCGARLEPAGAAQ